MKNRKDLVEVFGYAPDDLTDTARRLWRVGGCPYMNRACTKFNHDQSVTYGTCSVTSPYGDLPICPSRLYEKNYETIRAISQDAFGDDIPFLLFDEFIEHRDTFDVGVVALGTNSGREVQVGRIMSMDWVLAKIEGSTLVEYAGVEVQSIDITGNYRDAWHAYKSLGQTPGRNSIPSSGHGLNWANVHKRLIPQLIRKSVVYGGSKLVKNGLYFIVPDIVYQKFEDVIGADIPLSDRRGKDIMTVHTYELGDPVPHGQQRNLRQVRRLRFKTKDFADRFIAGPNLPSGDDIDTAVRRVLGLG